MNWELLWKVVLITTVAGFAVLAVITTIGGAFDCIRLFRRLDADKATGVGEQGEREVDKINAEVSDDWEPEK